MRYTLAWMAAILCIAPASAHGGADETALFVEAFDDDGFYFVVEGYEGPNPTIVLTPGETYSINFWNRGSMPHNFRVAPGDAFGTPLVGPGESAQLEFTVPPEGITSYWCDPHMDLGMKGAAVALSEELSQESPPVSLALVVLALVGVMTIRRRT